MTWWRAGISAQPTVELEGNGCRELRDTAELPLTANHTHLSFLKWGLRVCLQECEEPLSCWARDLLVGSVQPIGKTVWHCAEGFVQVDDRVLLVVLGVRGSTCGNCVSICVRCEDRDMACFCETQGEDVTAFSLRLELEPKNTQARSVAY